ncbi:MAG: DUF5686 family protein, partial [Dysgonamonadaceae bacterium]|nr:DUF5686 family protein [Dysgonamonadaceae bacterium]
EDYFCLQNNSPLSLVLTKTQTTSAPNATTTTPEKETLAKLQSDAEHSIAYKNLQRAAIFLLNHKLNIIGHRFEIGPLTHTISLNDMEGYRLRFAANTTEILNKHLQTGAYLAYGTRDKAYKFRVNLTAAISRQNRINISFLQDLNIPGRNILDDDRDVLYKSLKNSGGEYKTLQKVMFAELEKNLPNALTLKISAQHTIDTPKGLMTYQITSANEQQTIQSLTTFETAISFRIAPEEKYILIRGRKYIFKHPKFDLRFGQRFGFKGVAGSQYRYQITDLSASKNFNLPAKTGQVHVNISSGKIWNKVPFPLLFIPAGSQSRFVYEPAEYNLLNLYEAVSDMFLASNINLTINFSPLKIFLPKNEIQTNLGLKTLSGQLSNKNKPAHSANLFDFQNIISPIGDKPYLEGNIGFGNIFRLLRLDYVYRFQTPHKNAIMISLKLPL